MRQALTSGVASSRLLISSLLKLLPTASLMLSLLEKGNHYLWRWILCQPAWAHQAGWGHVISGCVCGMFLEETGL